MQTPSLSQQAVLQSPSARQGCPVSVLQRRTYKDARQTTTCLRAHQEQREPQDHSLEDLLVRSEESPCENTDAPWVPAKSSSQTPTEIVSPTVSPASEAISQKLCFQPKSKAASRAQRGRRRQGVRDPHLHRRAHKNARQTTTCLSSASRYATRASEPQPRRPACEVRGKSLREHRHSRAPAKSSSQTPTEIVSPIVSPASEAISQKLCFQPKSKVASGLAFARCPGLCVKIPDKCTRLLSETR